MSNTPTASLTLVIERSGNSGKPDYEPEAGLSAFIYVNIALDIRCDSSDDLKTRRSSGMLPVSEFSLEDTSMSEHFWTALSASLLAAGVTTLGLFVIRRFEAWGRRNAALFGSFAAGVLISVSFLHILPKAFALSVHAPAYCLAGYVVMHLSNRFITTLVCDRPETADYAIGLTPMIGIGVHSFIDGAVYAIAFKVSTFTGALAAIGMVLHEFPEGILTYLLLLRGGVSEKRALVLAFFAAALTTPVGMLASFPLVDRINEDILGAALSLSAGALVYVGATHLLPHAEREAPRYSIFALVGGVFVAIGIVLSK